MNTPFDFTPVDRILDSHPRSELSAIAILQDIQEYCHYLPREVFPYVAKAIGVEAVLQNGIILFTDGGERYVIELGTFENGFEAVL